MTQIPFILLGRVSLLANSTGTFSYPVPQNEELKLRDLVFSSTGAFSITGIRTADGRNYTNASSSAPIPSTVLASGANNNNNIRDFVPDLVVAGGSILYVDLIDTSGAGNVVNLTFNAERKVA